MGRIVIEQYGSVGTQANRDAPVNDLSTLIATTDDATTSTTAESVILSPGVRQITVFCPTEMHRVAVTNTTGTIWASIPAGGVRDFGVNLGSTVWYRQDA